MPVPWPGGILAGMAEPRLIIQLPRHGAVHLQLAANPLRSVASGEVVVDPRPADSHGHLETPAGGEVVWSGASPEALARDAEELLRVVGGAGTGDEPLVVVVEAAEELRDDELAPVLEGAERTTRAVILRIMGNG
jgi:hypothetical protein